MRRRMQAMNKTAIEWAEYTWNPITGCTPVSEGCANCYAKRMAKRLAGRGGYPADEPFRVTLHPERLEEPLRLKKPRQIFVVSMGDLFHDDVPDEFICRVFAVIALTPVKHRFLILTKRPHRMREFILGLPQRDETFRLWVRAGGEWPLSNLWLGVTVENQARADERIPILLQIPAAVRFVSVEPMLGPVSLESQLGSAAESRRVLNGWHGIDWVICGGETGPKARPMHPDWVRSLRDQCRDAGVPFLFKQWGEWAPADQIPHEAAIASPQLGPDRVRWMAVDGRVSETGKGEMQRGDTLVLRVGKRAAGRLLDGEIWDQYPNEGGWPCD